MNKLFTDNGWKGYVYWQTEDRKTLKKLTLYLKIYAEMEMKGQESRRRYLEIWLDFGAEELMIKTDQFTKQTWTMSMYWLADIIVAINKQQKAYPSYSDGYRNIRGQFFDSILL